MMKKAKNNPNHRNDLTRERILDEAEALFANKGYHAVSVREITRAARCNLAAVTITSATSKTFIWRSFVRAGFPGPAGSLTTSENY